MNNTLQNIISLVKSGFNNWESIGRIKVDKYDNLNLFNYTQECQYAAEWTPTEVICRGLVISDEGEVVARPFDKFFNWLEGGRRASGHIVSITEKIDGSLGILYRHNGKYKITTRGKLQSDQAKLATDLLYYGGYKLRTIPDNLTLMFEIIHPNDKHIVPYGNEEQLYLLAARDRFTGKYINTFPDLINIGEECQFPLPKFYSFNSIDDIIDAAHHLSPDHEGWVIEFSDKSRWKVKGDRYLEIVKIVSHLSTKHIIEAVRDGTYGDIIANIPDEYYPYVQETKRNVTTEINAIESKIEELYSLAPKNDRKTFAIWVNTTCPQISKFMFLRYDNKDYTSLLFDHMIKNYDDISN